MNIDGDPKLVITVDGVNIVFEGGQPVMDEGFENQALISLFTETGWFGNFLADDPEQEIGSDFEQVAYRSITLSSLETIRNSASRALDLSAFGNVEVNVTNPISTRINVVAIISPPGQDSRQLSLERNGGNWIQQAQNPAYRRI